MSAHHESLPYTKLGTGDQATYHVAATNHGTSLAPVMFSVRSGVFGFQDYLTPEEADLLGDALKAQAAFARAEDPETKRFLAALEQSS